MLRPNVLMLLVMVFITNQALAQDSRKQLAIKEWAEALDRYALVAIGSGDDARKEWALKRYFKLFPSEFKTFQYVYGYQEDVRGKTIQRPFVRHTLYEFLPELKSVIPAKEYYEKMLSVGVGGTWDADEVSILQKHLRDLVTENIQLSLEVLERKSEKKIRSFWHFLFDGPHPDDPINRKLYDSLYLSIGRLSPQIAEQLKLAYEQLLSKYDEHGH